MLTSGFVSVLHLHIIANFTLKLRFNWIEKLYVSEVCASISEWPVIGCTEAWHWKFSRILYQISSKMLTPFQFKLSSSCVSIQSPVEKEGLFTRKKLWIKGKVFQIVGTGCSPTGRMSQLIGSKHEVAQVQVAQPQ